MCESKKVLYIVMELITGSTLKDLIEKRKLLNQPFSEEEVATIMKAIFEAVYYLHDMHIIHRDIKPGIDYPSQFTINPLNTYRITPIF